MRGLRHADGAVTFELDDGSRVRICRHGDRAARCPVCGPPDPPPTPPMQFLPPSPSCREMLNPVVNARAALRLFAEKPSDPWHPWRGRG